MLIITGFFVAFGVTSLYFVNRYVHHTVRKLHNDIGGFILAAESVVYGVILAFVVVLVWEDASKAEDIAAAEGTVALALYRDFSLYPDQEAAQKGLTSLHEYVRVIVDQEYPKMKQMQWDTKDQVSRDAEIKSRELWQAIKEIVPTKLHEQTLYSEILKDRNELTQLRAKRVLAAKSDLPGAVWVVIVLGALFTTVFTALFGTENFKGHMIMVVLFAGMVGLSISLIVLLNYPFSGGMSIQPETFDYLLEIWK